MDVKKEDINICIKSIKKYILLDKFNIHKINIDTKSLYYKISVLYSNKNDKSQELYLEYILEREENIVLHCFSSSIEIYESKNIIKFLYYKDKWITISNIDTVEKHIKNTFSNISDFYEILNKNFYYTYNLENDKIKFLSKGVKNNINQNYDGFIKNTILDNKK